MFEGEVKGGQLYIGEDAVLKLKNIPDRPVYVGIRPEGYLPDPSGPLHCALKGVEVMGRDISIVSTNDAATVPVIRSIVSADTGIDVTAKAVTFSLKPHKVHLFDRVSGERIPFETV